ncbi:MAG: energy-coupling factor ABC transporter substrate-binding protein [Thermovenabulum sp.]|uniref:energy-coupling factor ABC transporter substrate-binding protein n=1 Tax=Thermovenabulum sp. TaxID=3100335 RepID=UPI003C7C121D
MRKHIFLIVLAIFIVMFSLYVGAQKGDLAGADEKMEEVIKEISPDYKPFFNSIFEPPSGEVESFLFALQASTGAFIIGYFLGKGKNA